MLKFSNFPWRGLAIILLIVSASLGFRIHRLSTALNNTFHYACTITAVDSETGAPLRGLGLRGPTTSSNDLMQQTSISVARQDGGMELSGVAYQPRIINIAADGYWPFDITITEDSPRDIRVPLKRKPSAKSMTPAEQFAAPNGP